MDPLQYKNSEKDFFSKKVPGILFFFNYRAQIKKNTQPTVEHGLSTNGIFYIFFSGNVTMETNHIHRILINNCFDSSEHDI